ncbi:MAG: DUF86 domain-containing protein [Phycisphaeraceae bacterium]|nr:DUF86 domain-containing protein [Phycisphaeraceae bacterium]
MPPEDEIRLRHMRDATHKALEFVAGIDRSAFDRDDKLVFALVKCIEIIGEAAARTSPSTRQTYPAIPWMAIIGMRNRLIHAYFDIDLATLWNTVQKDLPSLARALDHVLDEESR